MRRGFLCALAGALIAITVPQAGRGAQECAIGQFQTRATLPQSVKTADGSVIPAGTYTLLVKGTPQGQCQVQFLDPRSGKVVGKAGGTLSLQAGLVSPKSATSKEIKLSPAEQQTAPGSEAAIKLAPGSEAEKKLAPGSEAEHKTAGSEAAHKGETTAGTQDAMKRVLFGAAGLSFADLGFDSGSPASWVGNKIRIQSRKTSRGQATFQSVALSPVGVK